MASRAGVSGEVEARDATVSTHADGAYESFFCCEFSRVTGSIALMLNDRAAAEDVAQEAFVRLYRHWRRVSRYEKPEAWVRRVAIRIAIGEIRKRQIRDRFVQADKEARSSVGSVDPDLVSALTNLPAQQRAAIVLFYIEDRPVQEIAHLLDCSSSTVRVHLHKGRRRLAALLREEVAADVDR